MRFPLRQSLLTAVAAATLLAPLQSAHVAAQTAAVECSKDWVGREAELEAAMKTNKIAKLETVPIGVTKPERAILDPPTPVPRFVWKQLTPGYKNGYFESYKAEIAAYLLDRMLDLHMVPPFVERTINGKTGAAGYWINNTKNWDAKYPPQGPEPKWSYQITRMKMLDLLIANIDRNQGNLLYDADWHLFLIDHSRAFIGKKDLKNMAPLGRADRPLWEKMQALTFESLKEGLGEWVGDNDLKAMIIRRDLMAAEIKKLVDKRGENFIFFTER